VSPDWVQDESVEDFPVILIKTIACVLVVNANLKLTHPGDNRQSKSDPPLGTLWHHADAVFFAV
jgi:hypothetical protein